MSDFRANSVSATTEVSVETIDRLGRAMVDAEAPVALPPGIALTSRRATATTAAVLILNAVAGAVGKTVLIPEPANGSGAVSSFSDVVRLVDAMKGGDVDVLIVHDADPLYSMPGDSGFAAGCSA